MGALRGKNAMMLLILLDNDESSLPLSLLRALLGDWTKRVKDGSKIAASAKVII